MAVYKFLDETLKYVEEMQLIISSLRQSLKEYIQEAKKE